MRLFGWFDSSGPATAVARAPTAPRPPSTPAGESGWQRMRQPLRPQDLVLSSMARCWQASLKERYRADHLCAHYPRLANRLALCWYDPVLATKVLDGLLVDRRRGRTGFPPAVMQELIRLRRLRPSQAIASSFSPLWDARSMATCDR